MRATKTTNITSVSIRRQTSITFPSSPNHSHTRVLACSIEFHDRFSQPHDVVFLALVLGIVLARTERDLLSPPRTNT